MRCSRRLALFLLGSLGVGALFMAVAFRMPRDRVSPYGERINKHVVAERHVTDTITAVNFDYRGFDTLGEEFILFISVLGSLVLLRELDEQRRGPVREAITGKRNVPATDAARVWILGMIAPKVLFGLYIVAHGQLTPGGGFQGGVILATAALLIYLGVSFKAFQGITSFRLLEMAEAAGAGGFVLLGLAGIAAGERFLSNVLPFGEVGSMLSGGLIPAVNLVTALEVSAGFVLLLYGFMQHMEEEKA